MYTANISDATQRMPTNGRGGSAIARVITNAAIVGNPTATSVQVTDLGANVAVGDILFMGQGNWGVATSVNDTTDIVTVKRWYRVGGGVGTIPPSGGNLVAFPGGVLRTAVASIINGVIATAGTTTLTLIDPLGTTIAVALPWAGAPIKMWGPWRATAGAASGCTVSFETVGDLDT